MAIVVTKKLAEINPAILANLNPSAPNYYTLVAANAMQRMNNPTFNLGAVGVVAAPAGSGIAAIKFFVSPDTLNTQAVKNAL